MRLPSRNLALALGGLGLGLWALSRPSSTPASMPPKPSTNPPTPTGTKLTKHLSDDFFRSVAKMASDFQAKGATVTAQDILAVLLSESGVRSDILNKYGYGGLNQMGSAERKATGWQGTGEDFVKLSPDEQLPYTRRYFEWRVANNAGGDYKVLTGYGKLYLMNLAPAFIKASDPKTVVYGPGTQAYNANKGVDTGGKGYIDVADMTYFVDRSVAQSPALWNELRWRLQQATSPRPQVPNA